MTTDGATLHERISAALGSSDDERLHEVLVEARAADIAETFQLLHEEGRSRVLFALPPRIAAEVVVMLDEAIRGDVVDDLDTDSLTEIVSELPPDDAADVLGELDDDEVSEILQQMADEQSDRIGGLLAFDEATAGGIMTPEFVAVAADATIAEAVEQVRAASQQDDLNDVYVVDAEGRPVGTLPLRRMVVAPSRTKVIDVCDRDPLTVRSHDEQETVVQIIRKYDVSEVAVVDESDRLIGRITHDDLLDAADEEAAEDLYRMAGTDAAELETSSAVRAARIRLTWLLPCMVGMLVTATVLGVTRPQFSASLFGALALFVPMIGAMGGNSGIQISTIIVRGFATGELGATKLRLALMREGRIAMVMSLVCGVTAWLLVSISLPWLQSLDAAAVIPIDASRLSLAVGLAMASAILVAAMLGIALPFAFRRFGVDPAIASGPIVTTTNDVISVAVYMTLAMMIAR